MLYLNCPLSLSESRTQIYMLSALLIEFFFANLLSSPRLIFHLRLLDDAADFSLKISRTNLLSLLLTK